jgi:CubicO group peptidase (beta-lactamase class C family)
MKKISCSFVLLLLTYLPSWSQQEKPEATLTTNAPVNNLSSTKTAIRLLDKDIPQLMEKADIPGMSMALVRNGELVWTGAFGVMNADTKKKVTSETVFEAASLSKPVFAYGVLKLVDEGRLNLDTPLNKYLGNNYDVVGDERINLITARRVLSHTSGFPNWRSDGGSKNLPILFMPGEKFSYSGEGIVYLSEVVKKITGMSLENFIQQKVFQPLGMNSSSYIWQDRYDTIRTNDHDVIGNVDEMQKPKTGQSAGRLAGGNAAASLCTTAGDYAKFVIAILNGDGLKKKTWEQMLTPQIRVDPKYPQVAWGLGLGLETMGEGTYFWHWGDNGDAKAYVTAFLPRKDAVVYFANSANGLSITKEILADAIGGEHPAIAHLAYDSYNSSSRMLLKSIIANGAMKPLNDYREQRRKDSALMIDESKMNEIGYTLLRMKRLDDAIEVFRQNTIDFPGSWNVWDSFAEAYMDKGDKALAIKYYEKSLELNPANTNGADQLKKLKQ